MKKLLPDLLVILTFAVLSFAYFFPADIEDRILFQHDTAAGAGAGQEASLYRQETGEYTRWTNSLFGGMPTYQIAPSYDSTQPLTWVQKVYRLFLPTYVNLTFILMLGFFILLRAFGIPTWLAGLGGLMWAFSSYFFILISAGHIWKFITLAYIPPTIAGIVLAYRGKYLAGGIVTALFIALQILSNHVQMSYYFLFVILFIAGAYFEDAWRNKTLPQFFKASGVLVVAALIGISVNLSNLYHTYQYSKETMRGKSELVETGDAAKQTSSGLDRDYITQWSYGIGETWTLLVPNFKGGASVPLILNETAMEKANPTYSGLYQQLPQYFGDQPMTSGPVYVGAFVLFLFILGCFIVKGPLKWALVGATFFSIVLSWGKNFMPLTDFFIDYIPMYSKFRAVSSILVIAEFTIPLLAIFALKKILDEPEILKKKMKFIGVSLALTAGVALILAIIPGAFSSTFIPAKEAQMLQNAVNQQMIPANELSGILSNMAEMRAAMVSADALRSFIIIVIGCALLWLYYSGKLKRPYIIAGIAILCVIDMWGVNKRYLHDDQFVPRSTQVDTFKKTKADEIILQDTDPNYRVLNFSGDAFNENNTSYWHKSVGGYHAAKLRRYQDLIEHQLVNANPAVLNMLNTRYIIQPLENGKETVVRNPGALGNAWFVSEVKWVDNADAEMEAITDFDPSFTAVADRKFKNEIGEKIIPPVAGDTIYETAYKPDELTYRYQSRNGGLAVFSEIYFPWGWQVTVDGKPVDMARVNYVLRAVNLPAGDHEVIFRFDPQSVHTTEAVAYVSLFLILGAFVVVGLGAWKKRNDLSVED